MPIDHFSYCDNRTFDLRYLMSKIHWKSSGPIFFYCGNEGDIAMFANNTGFMWDIASKFGAMVVFAEHRYYGKTLPFGNQSYSNLKNLGKLSSEQALADYAVLVTFLKRTIPGASSSSLIAFGGSYGGMLAAWFRIKYPHLVLGALASSAPILQFQGLTECWVFPATATRTYRASGKNCHTQIRNSWEHLRQKAATDEGRDWLNANFHLCGNSKINRSEDIQNLVTWLNSGWSYLAMIDYPYPTDFLNPVPAWPVKVACKHLSFDKPPSPEDLLLGIYRAISVYQNYTGQKNCFSLAQETTSRLGVHGWNFQACTEMVMPMCQNGTDMFEKTGPWNFQEYSDSCYQSFGVRPREFWATTNYGGKNLKWASNIIFSNGMLDPWSGGGVEHPVGVETLVLKIKDGAHHYDLRKSDPRDTPHVLQARKLEVKMISQWLKQSTHQGVEV